MIYLIPNFLLIVVESKNDTFLKDLLKYWSKNKDLIRYDLPGRGNNFIKRKLNGLRRLIELRNKIKAENYKISFFEWGSTSLYRATRFFKFKKPVIVRIHRYEIYENTINKINFDKINKIILVSEFMKAEFLKKFPNLEKKIIIIPNAVDLEKFYPDLNKKTSYNICTLSYLIRRKRLDLVIDAMKHIQNPQVKLYIGGSGDQESIKNKIKQEQLEGRVFIEGRIESLSNWYKDKDFIINSAESEGFPVSLLEAMACSVIPLIRGWGGADTIFPNQFILAYDEMKFAKELANSIDKFYELTEEKFNSLRKFVRDFVSEHYSLEKQLQNFDNLFNSLITNNY